ncbi:helix-turn-helix domain-containing protein [Streptacidiphilus melanogenes]|uniref:helix-turn-helix domain-containing protein n=1 Tax=Streptacidiphilus melanogenes TaxID=411235 RepID=UPI0005AB0FEC|nr:helix-turn-helix transcriptional regulator [Streptacidiphilus melanogenes]
MAQRFSGQLLREKRIAAGIRPELLALQIDRSVWSVAEYERGTVQPPIPVLSRIADVLGCALTDLLTDTTATAA